MKFFRTNAYFNINVIDTNVGKSKVEIGKGRKSFQKVFYKSSWKVLIIKQKLENNEMKETNFSRYDILK